MSIEEIHCEYIEDITLDQFIKTAIKYYDSQFGCPQTNLREKAMVQWLDLDSHEDKVHAFQYMERKIKELEQRQTKITQFFKCQNQVNNPEEQQTAHKQSAYRKFQQDKYWKMRLENENLEVKQIREIVNREWHQLMK